MNLAVTETFGPGHNSANLRDELDVEIEQALKEFKDQLDERGGDIERCKITNDDEAGRATALAGILADIASGAEKRRVELKEPFLRSGKRVDAAFGAFTEIARKAKAGVVTMIDSYRREQERKAREAQEKLEREAREKAEAAERAAAAGNLVQAAKLEQQAETAAAQATEAAAPTTIRSSYGQTASGRTEWRFEVLDRKKLPPTVTTHPKVKEAQGAVIAQMIRGGVREIPGVRVFSESKTVIRR